MKCFQDILKTVLPHLHLQSFLPSFSWPLPPSQRFLLLLPCDDVFSLLYFSALYHHDNAHTAANESECDSELKELSLSGLIEASKCDTTHRSTPQFSLHTPNLREWIKTSVTTSLCNNMCTNNKS